MHQQRFDDLTRRVAASSFQLDRRTLLRAIGMGGAVTVSGSAAPPTLAQDATFAAPGGPGVEQAAFDLLFDIGPIFRFVRDEVIYDPYSGVLRGARGTLWGMAGNSADQALLLAGLLNASLVKTRFVIGELAEEGASTVLGSLRMDEAAIRAWSDKVLVPTSNGSADNATEPAAGDESLLEMLSQARDRLIDLVDRQLDDGIETVTGALAAAGIDLPEPTVTLPDLERTSHVWVQYRSGRDWVDLDPSVPGAEPGQTYADARETLDALPEDLFHRVSVRLAAEKVAAGAPVRMDLLTFEAASADLVGVPITLMHPDAEELKAAGVAIAEAIGGYRTLVPALIVGDQSVSGQPVTFVTGADAFGDLSTEGDTLAEWLEIDIHTPVAERRIVRELFDRVAPAARASGSFDPAAIPMVELGDVGGASPSFPPLARVWSVGVVTSAIPGAYVYGDATDDALVTMSRAVHTYHHVQEMLGREKATLRGQRWCLDEPNLTAVVHSGLARSVESTERQSGMLEMDLLHRHGQALPVVGAQPESHPQVAAGVFSHAIERGLVEVTGTAMLDLRSDDFLSVGRVFEEARRQEIPTVVLQPGLRDASSLEVDEAARIRIAAALEEGYVVIVPERAVSINGTGRTGWWLVDPGTGTTLDQLDNGRGATLPEWARIALFVACYGIGFYTLGLFTSMTGWLSGEVATPYTVGTFIENWVKLNVGCFGGAPVPDIPEGSQ
jgi:hypothetical protein